MLRLLRGHARPAPLPLALSPPPYPLRRQQNAKGAQIVCARQRQGEGPDAQGSDRAEPVPVLARSARGRLSRECAQDLRPQCVRLAWLRRLNLKMLTPWPVLRLTPADDVAAQTRVQLLVTLERYTDALAALDASGAHETSPARIYCLYKASRVSEAREAVTALEDEAREDRTVQLLEAQVVRLIHLKALTS